ncbi:hypothetical protein EV715DRAFT_268355 [Schizophyllum commune]
MQATSSPAYVYPLQWYQYRLMTVLSLEIPPEILSSIVQLMVDEEEGGIAELERWPADPSDEEENMPIDGRAIVRCPPAFINTRGFRQACRLWREVASSVKVKTFSVIVGRWCATAEEGLSLAKDIGAENIVIDTREDRHHQDRPDLLLAEEATMQRLLDSPGKWRSITLLLAYVPQLPRLPISFPSEPTLSSLDITFRKSKMDLRAVKALNIRNKGMLDVWLQKIIDDAIDILPSVTTIGLDVSLMRRHVLYPYFACSDVARAKLTRLVLYGPDVLASRRLPTTPDLSWVSQVPVLQELGLHGVGLEEHGLIQLLAGVATISRFEITQHPCTRWTSRGDAMDTPYYPHPVGPEVCANLAAGDLLPNVRSIWFGEGSWAEEGWAAMHSLAQARGQHLRLRVSSSRCPLHAQEGQYRRIRDALGDEHCMYLYGTLD